MKTNLKRLLIILMSAVTVCMAIMNCSAISETDDGIAYEINDGYVVIKGYKISDGTLDIPSKIKGLPVTEIGEYACKGNKSITKLNIPSSVKKIGDYAFSECENMNTVTFEDGCTEIGFNSFSNCDSLKTVKLPATLKIIDDYAFYNCFRLGTLSIPKSLETIGHDAFLGCESLQFKTGGNKAAEECAKQYSIPTSFTETWTFTCIMLLLATIILFIAVTVIRKFFKKRLKRIKKRKV